MTSAPLLGWLLWGLVAQDPAASAEPLPAPTTDAPPAPAAPRFADLAPTPDAPDGDVLPVAVQDQLIAFVPESELQVERGPVTVRVWGKDLTTRAVVRQVQVPVLGRHRRRLDWPEFYERVGAPDLAATHRRRSLASAALTLGGGLMSVGAGAPMLLGMLAGLGMVFWDQGILDGRRRATSALSPVSVGGIGVILLGAVSMTAGILAGGTLAALGRSMPIQPVEEHEILRLADEHNADVLQRAGVRAPSPPLLAPGSAPAAEAPVTPVVR